MLFATKIAVWRLLGLNIERDVVRSPLMLTAEGHPGLVERAKNAGQGLDRQRPRDLTLSRCGAAFDDTIRHNIAGRRQLQAQVGQHTSTEFRAVLHLPACQVRGRRFRVANVQLCVRSLEPNSQRSRVSVAHDTAPARQLQHQGLEQ